MLVNMGRGKTNETALQNSTPVSPSLRTTVPEHIVTQLELQSKDKLLWKLEKNKGVWIAIIQKKNIKRGKK